MDDLDEETPRDLVSRREQRWSMSSSRLEEIVAELMRPIGDLRHSFDTDISALLEEYLTQAGLHALDADADYDGEVGTSGGGSPVPNFPELALLLQHSASVYGRKVDCLYQHVLAVSDSLQTSSVEDVAPPGLEARPGPETPSGSARRKRNSHDNHDFALIDLETSANALREGGYVVPPVLARGLVELEPRVLRPRDVQLLDYAGEPIGLIQDYHLTRPLADGGLVPEGAVCAGGGGSLRGVPLHELQAAIEAAAPPPLPPPRPHKDHTPPPSPLPTHDHSCELSTMPPPTVSKVQRKRKSDVTLDEITGKINFTLSKGSLRKLRRFCEFSLPPEWIVRLLTSREKHIRHQRLTIHDTPKEPDFPGWSSEESLAALARVSLRSSGVRSDSDDDGFFEQSSSSESDLQTCGMECEWSWWAAAVARRADDTPGMDVADSANKVLAAAVLPLPSQDSECSIKEGSHPDVPFSTVLRRAATHPTDVSRLFLATLFLANSGNVEIVPGAALALDSFCVRVRSTDAGLYSATLSADLHNATPSQLAT